MNYQEFSQLKCQELMKIQDGFIERYNINSYDSWFYDSETELLRLYNGDTEIYFRYIPIGTFSTKSGTWMWSRCNESSLEKSKDVLLDVKEFGVQNNYEKLIDCTFSADEYDCWELSAICRDLLQGIGVYKVNTNDLEKFMLIMSAEDAGSLKVKQLKQKTVDCKEHGYSRPAFVCGHLNLVSPKGFNEAFDTHKDMDLEEDEDFQAWCDDCEKTRIRYGGWNDESEKFARIKLICENCYFELKEFNQAN
jgi:hypothetical protein